jgi:hypothetical protein
MAEHNTIFTGPETQEAFLADRQRAFAGFVQFTTISSIFLAILLALMAIFLL